MPELAQSQNDHKRMEKQIGCMSSFLQIFDRHQILAGKRLPPSTVVGASPEKVNSGESQEFSQKLKKPEAEKNVVVVVRASADNSQSSPAKTENCRQISPATFKPKELTTIDGDNNQRRPASVIARLMGLEPLTSDQKPPQTVTKPALPRSGSECRVSRDRTSKYIDGDNFQVKQPNRSQKPEYALENLKSESSRTSSRRSRSFFHSSDFFPEPNQTTVTVIMHGDLEKRSKMRGMDEQFSDLSALKQIVEVLQLKGLLHSTNRSNRDNYPDFVYDRNESSIHLKQSRSLASKLDQQRSVNESRGDRSARIPVKARTASAPNRIESNLKSCNSIIKRKPLSIEIERKANESSDSLRRSPIHSPKKTGSVHHSATNRSSRNHKLTESSSVNSPKQNCIKNAVTDDESSSRSESIVNASSTTDSQRFEWEGCREGKRLLERCGKLLNSIAEMNGGTESSASSGTVLPSPVSVLESGFDKDESLSPSHSIDFKATPTIDFKDENRSPKISPTKSTQHNEFISDDSDFIYITKILQSSQHLHEDPNVFFSIEKQLYNTENTSTVSKRQRKLVFDVIVEILNRNRELPPWKTSIECSRTLLIKQIWSEFQKLREVNAGGGLLELISGVLKRDLVEIKGWGDYPIETSEAILDVERMIFKDLVSEAIGDLVKFSGECMFSRTRRKLVF